MSELAKDRKLEVVGRGEVVLTEMKYVDHKRSDVLKTMFRRIFRGNLYTKEDLEKLRYFIIEREFTYGYFNPHYPPMPDDVCRETGREEISFQQLQELMKGKILWTAEAI